MTYDRRARALQPEDLKDLLLRIDNGDFHTIPKKGFPAADKEALQKLLDRKWVREISQGHLPPHYVLTSGGSHMIDTFKHTTMASRVAARFVSESD